MSMANYFADLKAYIKELKAQDFAFLFACGYLMFSYLRPHAIYPELNIIPWTQLCIILGMAAAIKNRQVRLGEPFVLLMLYFLIIVLSSLSSSYPEVSWSKLDVAYIWLAEVIFFISCVKNLNQLKLALILFMIFMFKMSLFGARTWIGRGFGFTKWGISGPAGYFSNSGEFALLMAIVAVLSISMLIGFNKLKSWYILLPITAVMTVLAASSRGGQLALLVGLVSLALLYRKLSLKYLISFALIGYLIYSFIPEEQMERFRTMGDDSTSQTRLVYWQAGWEMMNEHPVLGVGHYAFPDYFNDYYKHRLESTDSYFQKRKEVAHNSFIEVGSSLGYAGLIIYCLLLAHIYRNCSRVSKAALRIDERHKWILDLAKGIKASLFTYIVGSFFMSVEFYPYIYLLIMISYVLYVGSKEVIAPKEYRGRALVAGQSV